MMMLLSSTWLWHRPLLCVVVVLSCCYLDHQQHDGAAEAFTFLIPASIRSHQPSTSSKGRHRNPFVKQQTPPRLSPTVLSLQQKPTNTATTTSASSPAVLRNTAVPGTGWWRGQRSAGVAKKKSQWRRRRSLLSRLLSKTTDDDDASAEEDKLFNINTTIALLGGQSILVIVAGLVAIVCKTPNYGLGPGIALSLSAIQWGALSTVPLGIVAWILDLVEENVPALQDVTTATQRSILALLGGTFKPTLAVVVSVLLGLAAGIGEEMLFRGVLQYEIIERLPTAIAASVATFVPPAWVGIIISSIIFGLLHAVTPMYAILAFIASVYFGWLYLTTGNLVIPIACHTLYDIGALLFAHWTVTKKLSEPERRALSRWKGPGTDGTLL